MDLISPEVVANAIARWKKRPDPFVEFLNLVWLEEAEDYRLYQEDLSNRIRQIIGEEETQE